jgi:hypothetical protein
MIHLSAGPPIQLAARSKADLDQAEHFFLAVDRSPTALFRRELPRIILERATARCRRRTDTTIWTKARAQ